jgi:signal transduction histidine kinase
MAQAFLNLITNARQAMSGGGTLRLTAARNNGHVAVSVSDTGTGVRPEHVNRLFEPLFSTKTFGTGLGLAVSKSFVEANRGTIAVESEVGKGTVVTVVLPAAT